MANLSDVREHIKGDLRINGTTKDTQIDNAIRSALRRLRGKKYWFLQAIGNITLPSGDSSLLVTDYITDFSAAQAFELSYGGVWLKDASGFDYLDYERFSREWLKLTTLPSGHPEACSLLGYTLYCSHTANQDYLIRCSYYKQDAILPVQGTDASIWFDEGYDVVRSLAMLIFKTESQDFRPTPDDRALVRDYEGALAHTGMSFEQGSR